MSSPLLEVRDLGKSYGSQRALDGVSLVVEAGEIFGLLGPNGAGKTTLLSIVAGLLEADSGSVYLEGAVFRPGDRDLRRTIGIVPQEIALYGELTAAENLRFFGELYGVRGGELDHRVAQIVKALGLDDRADGRVAAFSGGMQRRLNLGAALVHQPRLLLLDEPTAGVDPQSRRHLFEEIRRLNREGVTIVYTSHYMEEVQALCARIGIIDHGRLIACDTLEHLLRRLPGRIVFRVQPPSAAFAQEAAALPGASRVQFDGDIGEVQCEDTAAMFGQLLATARAHQAELTVLDLQRPNLESVFLHLTGHALRD
jgi:ABC-2 type transport system ATP-binding protein